MKPIILFLTCASKKEADKIAADLISAKLVACAKTLEVDSRFLWHGRGRKVKEVLLVMDSTEDKYPLIEAAVGRVHSYQTFVLTAIEVANTPVSVRQWLDMELGKITQETNLRQAKLYTDGGSRGNPGPSAGAYVICKMDDNVVEKSGFLLGNSTNNRAEYEALCRGLEKAASLGIPSLQVYMDSELVIKQVNGLYKVKHADMAPLHQRVKELSEQFENISFTHVPRAANKTADQEVNRVLDEH